MSVDGPLQGTSPVGMGRGARGAPRPGWLQERFILQGRAVPRGGRVPPKPLVRGEAWQRDGRDGPGGRWRDGTSGFVGRPRDEKGKNWGARGRRAPPLCQLTAGQGGAALAGVCWTAAEGGVERPRAGRPYWYVCGSSHGGEQGSFTAWAWRAHTGTVLTHVDTTATTTWGVGCRAGDAGRRAAG